MGEIQELFQRVQEAETRRKELANGGGVPVRTARYWQVSQCAPGEPRCLLEESVGVVGRLLIPDNYNIGRLLRLVALGLLAEAAGQVPPAAWDQRQPCPDASQEDCVDLECPATDLVHESTGEVQDKHGRPVEEIHPNQNLRSDSPSLPPQYIFDAQLTDSSTGVGDNRDGSELESWKGFLLSPDFPEWK